MEPERLATPADALGVIDRVQRGVRDQLVLAMPRIPWARAVLFPTFLLLLGSEAARGQRADGTNDVLLGIYVVLAVTALVRERLAEQRRGLMIARRRFPRAGRRQMLGVWVVIGGISTTNILGAVTDAWWIGLPVGVVAAATVLWGRARWIASFDRVAGGMGRGGLGPSGGPMGTGGGGLSGAASAGVPVGDALAGLGAPAGARLPGNLPPGPFASLAAVRLGALLVLADRAQPARLEAALELPEGSLVEASDALASGGLVRVLPPAGQGQGQGLGPDHGPIVAFTGQGRRAFRAYLAKLTRP